jgi:hypothetical protein
MLQGTPTTKQEMESCVNNEKYFRYQITNLKVFDNFMRVPTQGPRIYDLTSSFQ